MRIDFKKEGINLKIAIYGSKKDIEHAKSVLDNLTLCGAEAKDRLTIQNAIDEYNIKAAILYDGNTVWGYKKLVAEIKRMKKSGSIEKISNNMYEFLRLNFDIAHYDKQGYIYYYDGSYSNLLKGIKYEIERTPQWKSDVKRIAENF